METGGHSHISEQTDFGTFKGDSLLRLDLGCGKVPREGFKGVDMVQLPKVAFVHDLNLYPWPFDDNSVYEIFTSHFVEHVESLKIFMEECYRILMDQSTITILAPYYSSVRASQDFTHKRAISEFTFPYFSQEALKGMGIDHYDVKCDFKIESVRYYFSSEWITRADIAKEWARKHQINVVDDIEVGLRALKREH